MSSRPWTGVTGTAWFLVAQREASTKLRDRTFLLATGFLLAFVLGSVVVPALLGDGETEVAVTDSSGARVVERAAAAGDESFVARLADSRAAAEERVVQGEVDVALLPVEGGFELVGDTSVDGSTSSVLQTTLTTMQMKANAARAGLTPAELTQGAGFDERLLDPSPLSPGLAKVLTFGFAMLFFITALTFGMQIAQSVLHEKETRIVEILAAAVPVRALLAGKVVGNTLLALGQLLLIGLCAAIGMQVTGRGDDMAKILGASGWFLAFFVVGFIALASLWSVAGSMSTRQEDLQSATLPAQALLLIPFFVVVSGGERVLAIASYVPIASSLAMPVRVATGDLPLWQPLLALAIVVVAAVLLVVLGARMYERSLLQTQRRMSYRELLRASR